MSAFEDKSGKIGETEFANLIRPRCGKIKNEVVIGPLFGVDTGVIDLGNNLGMAVSSDPLSLVPTLGLKESAWLSVQLLVNDMATTGFAPMYAQMVLNLPPGLSREDFEEYWNYIHLFCEKSGVAITGGHTCQIEGQNSTLSGGGTMFLTAPLDQIISSNGAGPGDKIIMTKETALISTSILAMSFPETVKKEFGETVYEKACSNFYRTSVLDDALAAAEVLENNTELKAMHDVTEGGVLGAVAEMAAASGCGFRIMDDLILSGNAPVNIAELFEIDHRRIVGAGSMIMAVKAGLEESLIAHLLHKNIPSTVIGEFTHQDKGFVIVEDGEETPFKFDGKDPYWGAFFNAIKSGWK